MSENDKAVRLAPPFLSLAELEKLREHTFVYMGARYEKYFDWAETTIQTQAAELSALRERVGQLTEKLLIENHNPDDVDVYCGGCQASADDLFDGHRRDCPVPELAALFTDPEPLPELPKPVGRAAEALQRAVESTEQHDSDENLRRAAEADAEMPELSTKPSPPTCSNCGRAACGNCDGPSPDCKQTRWINVIE